jgi:hypothetical protein
MPDPSEQLLQTRKRLVHNLPDPSIALAGSLMSRMVRCNKAGCRFCQKPRGKGHGPIWILSVSQGNRRVHWLKQVAQINQELLEERKRR